MIISKKDLSLDFINAALKAMSASRPSNVEVWGLEKTTHCACGKKEIPISKLKPFWTGYIYALDYVCPDCEKEFAKLSHFACVKCKRGTFHTAPHKTKDGFIFGKNCWYHLDACPECDSSVTDSKIIELVIYRDTIKKTASFKEKILLTTTK